MIKELPKKLEGSGDTKGFTYEQKDKRHYGYIYRAQDSAGVVHFEVFERRLVHLFDFETNTQLEDQKVSYPKSNDFGVWAWCYRTYEQAWKKLEEIGECSKNN